MPKVCDRSPCDRLMKALGRFMFGVSNSTFTLEVATPRGRETAMVEYCPFCGTRLEEIGPGLLQKFLPKGRRKAS